MGIFMHLLVSGAVTPNEWQAAYQETLKLVQAFSLGELRQKEVAGVPVYCLTPTEERTQPAAWRKNGAWTGWTANGDLLTLRTAEEYCLPRDLENELAYDPSGGDAALAHAANVLFRDKTPVLPATRHLWGGKTQGEPYHIALLAIGCLLADRLGCKVYIHGDITLGQCRAQCEQLLDYRTGDQIHPLVMGKLQQFRPFFQSLPKEPEFHDLVSQSARQRCRWLADNNRQLLLRDSDWQQIFAQIEENLAAFARYYPMDRLQLQNDDAIEIMHGLVLNDALYTFFQTLPEEESE